MRDDIKLKTYNQKNKFLIKSGDGKMYKTVVIAYLPKADDMAQKVEEKANEMLQGRKANS